jgi:formamidopyrimidine-DNA glycosylase
MSIELPEIMILSGQMDNVLRAKVIEDIVVDNYENLQKFKFFNADVAKYDLLKGCRIKSVKGRGTVIKIECDKNTNLLLAPEMGGDIRYYEKKENLPKKLHLRVDFTDGSCLTVSLKGFGLVYVASDDQLEEVYSYKRDFLKGVSPLEEDFTFEYMLEALERNKKTIKTLMVGKDAIVVGLGNAGFQEIAYEAGIHPKKRGSSLQESEKKALHSAIRTVVESRIRNAGKTTFWDLFGKRGTHTPSMGGHMRDRPCPRCGTTIERLSFEGGPTYLCPACQKE